MGSITSHHCRLCGTDFAVHQGGGFRFDLLHCEQCGRNRAIDHAEMGDIHLAFVKGLPGPYAVSRSEADRRIKATYPGAPIDEAAYHAAVETSLEDCECGGRFRYDAPPRCPTCRSTSESWDATMMGGVLYD